MKISSSPINLVSLVRNLHPTWRAVAISLISAIGAYFSVFGAFALLGFWRSALFEPGQMAIVIGLLLSVVCLCRLANSRRRVVLVSVGSVMSLILLIYVLSVASRNDYPSVILIVCVPFLLCLGASWLVETIEYEVAKAEPNL